MGIFESISVPKWLILTNRGPVWEIKWFGDKKYFVVVETINGSVNQSE